MSWLIVVTGRPAAGKSTLATWLGEQLAFPVISKDAMKEVLFNVLGWRDRVWSRVLGRAGVELMYYITGAQLEAGKSVILDCAFDPDLASAKLRALATQYGANTLQIICDADNDVLYDRFRQRAESGIRHEGHVEMQSLDEFKAKVKQEQPLLLDIGGQVLQVDTTDWATICYDAILDEVLAVMGGSSETPDG